MTLLSVVVHIQQTPRNHGSVSKPSVSASVMKTDKIQTFFLPWHRYYIWHYENALRTECNYTGYQPASNYREQLQDALTNK
jgi:tyrosinase